MKKLMLRFNHNNTGNLFWRCIIEGEEKLADSVTMYVPSATTEDILPSGEKKFHLTCWYNKLTWNGNNLTVE